MYRAAGRRYSPNWHQVALMNLARLRQLDIGAQGYAGWALSVTVAPDCVPPAASGEFVLEHRGPGAPPIRIVASWVTKKRFSTVGRQRALNQILDLLERNTKEFVR